MKVQLRCPVCSKEYTRQLAQTHIKRKTLYSVCSRKCAGVMQARFIDNTDARILRKAICDQVLSVNGTANAKLLVDTTVDGYKIYTDITNYYVLVSPAGETAYYPTRKFYKKAKSYVYYQNNVLNASGFPNFIIHDLTANKLTSFFYKDVILDEEGYVTFEHDEFELIPRLKRHQKAPERTFSVCQYRKLPTLELKAEYVRKAEEHGHENRFYLAYLLAEESGLPYANSFKEYILKEGIAHNCQYCKRETTGFIGLGNLLAKSKVEQNKHHINEKFNKIAVKVDKKELLNALLNLPNISRSSLYLFWCYAGGTEEQLRIIQNKTITLDMVDLEIYRDLECLMTDLFLDKLKNTN